MAVDIKHKAALVTGGGSGICLELTRRLLAGDCSVLIVDLALRPEAKDLLSGSHADDARCAYFEADVTDWKQLRAAFEKVIGEFDRLDIVVPGAGVFEPPSSNFRHFSTPSTLDTDAASSYKIFDINVSHPIRATQLAIDAFIWQGHGGGIVVHIASIAAQLALLPVPLYCASKHAISAFVRSMGPLEPELRIRVVAVAPGIVKTPLWSAAQLAWMDDAMDAWVSTGQVADAMLGLITREEFVGGTVLEVGAEKTRMVELLNDPGPQGRGHSLANMASAFVDALQLVGRNFGRCEVFWAAMRSCLSICLTCLWGFLFGLRIVCGSRALCWEYCRCSEQHSHGLTICQRTEFRNGAPRRSGAGRFVSHTM